MENQQNTAEEKAKMFEAAVRFIASYTAKMGAKKCIIKLTKDGVSTTFSVK